MKTLVLWIVISMATALSAQAQGEHAGGGDAKSEGRIKSIRDNILAWIEAGQAKQLQFNANVDYDTYVFGSRTRPIAGMKAVLKPDLGTVIVNVIKTSEEIRSDEELSTWVDGKPKTCKWFRSMKDYKNHILCNYERFWDQSEAEQYRLIHHEYAGLAGVEMSQGSDSDYFFSNQITGRLVYERVLRLPIAPPLQASTENMFAKIHEMYLASDPIAPGQVTNKLWVGRCFLENKSRAYGSAFYQRSLKNQNGPLGDHLFNEEMSLGGGELFDADKFDYTTVEGFLDLGILPFGSGYFVMTAKELFKPLVLDRDGTEIFPGFGSGGRFRMWNQFVVSEIVWSLPDDKSREIAHCYYYRSVNPVN